MILDLNEKEVEILKIQMESTMYHFKIEVFNNRVNHNYDLAESNENVVKVIEGILNKIK
jgi:hypothetical protein